MEIALKGKLEKELQVKVSKMKPVIKPTVPHKHDGYHELIILTGGSGTHRVNDQEYAVKPFDAFYLQPGSVHCWDFSQVPEGYVLLFREDFLKQHLNTLNSLYKLPQKFEVASDHQLIPLIETLYASCKLELEEDILAAHVNLILLHTLAMVKEQIPASSSVAADFIQFKNLVNIHFLELRTVQDYAQLMNITVPRLNNICQQAAYTTALNVIKERIIVESKNLITHTSLTITEIAYKLNFSDASNFIKFFKAQTRLTPSAYREALHRN